ncbi:MAG: hypothetical protein EHM93_07850 [Bacteroidales bacterium]|nr:MAG: hypothetical protein EHM93_07850 [Bacteroidales bacterium]
MKKRLTLLFLTIAVFTPYSCEDFNLFVDCDKCYTDLSDKYSIEYQVTLDHENRFVPITLYRGSIDNGLIISEDTVHLLPHYSVSIDFGEQYSAVAKYTHKGRVIFAVDGKKLRKKRDKSSCEETCYTIEGDVLDLRLK